MTRLAPEDYLFTCDVCGEKFDPAEDTYIGPVDPTNTSCSAFVEYTYLCPKHAADMLAKCSG